MRMRRALCCSFGEQVHCSLHESREMRPYSPPFLCICGRERRRGLGGCAKDPHLKAQQPLVYFTCLVFDRRRIRVLQPIVGS